MAEAVVADGAAEAHKRKREPPTDRELLVGIARMLQELCNESMALSGDDTNRTLSAMAGDIGAIEERLDDLTRAFTRLAREVGELRKNGG